LELGLLLNAGRGCGGWGVLIWKRQLLGSTPSLALSEGPGRDRGDVGGVDGHVRQGDSLLEGVEEADGHGLGGQHGLAGDPGDETHGPGTGGLRQGRQKLEMNESHFLSFSRWVQKSMPPCRTSKRVSFK